MKFFLFIFLIFISCSSSIKDFKSEFEDLKKEKIEYREIYLDNSFSGIERDIILNSLNEWSKVTYGYFQYQEKSWHEMSKHNECPKKLMFIRHLSEDQRIINIETSIGFGITGYADRNNSECNTEQILIVADKLKTKYYYRFTVLHEIGHILKLNHNDDLSIMNSFAVNEISGITKKDLENLIKNH